MLERLRISTIWLTLITCMTIALGLSLLNTCQRRFTKKKRVCAFFEISCVVLLLYLNAYFSLLFVEMGTRYSNEKYARIKGMKNEPLSQLATNPKKQKLNEEKGETFISSSVHTIPSSLTLSLEVMVVTPPTTRSKGKSKIGKSV